MLEFSLPLNTDFTRLRISLYTMKVLRLANSVFF